MALAARRLPIVRGCPIRGALPGDTGAERTIDCRHCGSPVHDLTRRSEREVRRLLAAHVGRSICVQYRVRANGDLVLRDTRSAVAAASVGALLTACAGHLDELEGDALVDPCEQGQCRDASAAIPDEPGAADHDARATDERDAPGAHGRPRVDPAARPVEGPDGLEADAPTLARTVAASDRSDAADASAGPHFIANFAIDPAGGPIRGAMVIGDQWHDDDGRPRWLPTRQLLAQWRDRMRERRRLRSSH